MKASIFDMTFTLPPLIEMVDVEKEMPAYTQRNETIACWWGLNCGA